MKHSVKQMIESSPALIATTRVYTDNFALALNGVLNIYYNLTDADCDLIIEQNILRQIQFARKEKFHDTTLKLINERLLPTKSNIFLSETLNGYGAFNNLNFLAHLPNLKCLHIALLTSSKEIEKINRYLNLHELVIGTYKTSLKGIEQQINLQKLSIFDKPKDVEIAGQMSWLECLSFSGQTLNDLNFITPLTNLKELGFFGGKIKDLLALPEIGKIEKLYFTRVGHLTIQHLQSINDMKYLKELSFSDQPQLTDLTWLQNKSIKIRVEGCKNLKQ